MRRIKIIDRFLLQEFWSAFLATTSFCALLLVIGTLFGKLQDILANNAPLDKVLLFFLYSLPFKLIQIMPIVATLAVLFALGGLARNNEILALLTNGVHSLRIAAPIAASGGIIVAGVFFLSEFVVPQLEEKARYIELRYIEAKSESKLVTRRDIFARGVGNRFYLMRMYDSREGRMYSPQIVDLTEDYSTLRQRIDAKEAVLVAERRAELRSQWKLDSPRIWSFDEKGNLQTFQQFQGPHTAYLEPDLSVILGQRKKPDEMNFFELWRHIQILAQRQQPVFSYYTDLYRKLTFPFSILLAMMIGFSYAVRTRAGNATSAIGYGIAWAIGLYAVMAFFTALGRAGALAPVLAAAMPLVIFGIIGAFYVRKSYRWFA